MKTLTVDFCGAKHWDIKKTTSKKGHQPKVYFDTSTVYFYYI